MMRVAFSYFQVSNTFFGAMNNARGSIANKFVLRLPFKPFQGSMRIFLMPTIPFFLKY